MQVCMEFIELNPDVSVIKTVETSVHQVSRGQSSFPERGVSISQLSPERGVHINAQDENDMTPSHLQSNFGPVQIAQALLDHGANVYGNNVGETSLYQESEGEYYIQYSSLDIPRCLTRMWHRRACTK